LSYINKDVSLEDISKIVYCIDFLYSKIELKPNELTQLISNIKKLKENIDGFYQIDGSYRSSLKVSPLEETRYALFSINLLEDLIQDMIYYYSVTELELVKKIYENVRDIQKTYKLIKEAEQK
jgi:predicted Ser/Thr protein kinase